MALGDYNPQRRTTPNTQSGSKLCNFWIVIPNLEYGTLHTDTPPQGVSDRVHYAVRYSPVDHPWQKKWPGGAHKLVSCYIRYEEFDNLVAVREELQDLADFYPDSLRCVGCWDFNTGEPIGGVGSPWFTTPAWVFEDFPTPKYTSPGGEERTGSRDVILMSGQAKRKFV